MIVNIVSCDNGTVAMLRKKIWVKKIGEMIPGICFKMLYGKRQGEESEQQNETGKTRMAKRGQLLKLADKHMKVCRTSFFGVLNFHDKILKVYH